MRTSRASREQAVETMAMRTSRASREQAVEAMEVWTSRASREQAVEAMAVRTSRSSREQAVEAMEVRTSSASREQAVEAMAVRTSRASREQVVEAVAATQMAAAPVNSTAAGMLEFTLSGVRTLLPVYDACRLSGQAALADPTGAVAIIVRCGEHHIGLLVDRLIDVIACESIDLPPGGVNPDAPWINGYIHDGRPDTAPVWHPSVRFFRVERVPLVTINSHNSIEWIVTRPLTLGGRFLRYIPTDSH